MNKLGWVLCFMLIGRAEVHAQTLQWGIKGGAGVSTLVGTGTSIEPKPLPLIGLVGGIYRIQPFRAGSPFSWQLEVLYSQLGHRLSHPSTNYSATLRYNYLSVPALLTTTYRHYFVVGGVQASYLVGVRERYTFQAPNATGQITNNNTDPNGLTRWDAALVAGVGYRWDNSIGLELRYLGSLNSIYPDRGGAQRAKPRNAAVQVYASYLLTKR